MSERRRLYCSAFCRTERSAKAVRASEAGPGAWKDLGLPDDAPCGRTLRAMSARGEDTPTDDGQPIRAWVLEEFRVVRRNRLARFRQGICLGCSRRIA